jgi:hypothetical protein
VDIKYTSDNNNKKKENIILVQWSNHRHIHFENIFLTS